MAAFELTNCSGSHAESRALVLSAAWISLSLIFELSGLAKISRTLFPLM
jgi:hypothetical protein